MACRLELASDVEGLRPVLGSVLGERHRARVADDGAVVGFDGASGCTTTPRFGW